MKNLSDVELLSLSLRFQASDSYVLARFTERVRQPIDWMRYQERFIDERLEGYFFYNLKRGDLLSLIPDRVRFSFARIAAETAADNLALLRSLRIVADYLEAENIPFIALKGIHLLGSVYRDYPLRRMSDIDILIHAESLPALDRVLCEHGFTVSVHDNPSVRHSRILAPVLHELMFERADCKIDVHWGIAKADGIAMMNEQRFWDRAGTIDLEGKMVSVLSVEDLVLHLSAHLYKNMMRKKMQLVMFCDIIDVLRHYADTFDWSYVIQAVRQEKLERVVYSLLACLQKEGFCKVPSLLQSELSLYQPLCVDRDGRLTCRVPASEGIYYTGLLKGISGLRNKVFFVRSILFPSKKWLYLYHPDVAIKSSLCMYIYHWKVSLIKVLRVMKELLR